MNLELNRLKDNGKATIGTLTVDGVFECFTVEDANHEVKVADETCIPEGTYEIKLRNEGGMTKRYAAKFDFHRGMLWLQNVQNFEWVYIHVGNYASQSSGCILVNGTCDSVKMTGGNSGSVYAAMYGKILAAMDAGESVTINVTNLQGV